MNAVITQKAASTRTGNPGITRAHLDCEKRHRMPVVECQITPQTLAAHGPPCTSGRGIVFADADVWQRFEPVLSGAFHSVYADVQVVRLAGGESCKTLETLQQLLAHMATLQVLRRGDALYALGGGSVLDVVGFAASIFRRGVPLTKIPTSLLAQVDAAISLKNAINLGTGKNLVGSFVPPHSVLVDFRFLDTLPLRHWSNGMAEIIKLGLMVDAPLMHALAAVNCAALDGHADLRPIFRKAITGMVGQLNENPYEQHLQRAVDFGHWLSPQLEMAVPGLLHGEAVAIDMAVSLTLSLRRGRLAPQDWALGLSVLAAWQLPLTHGALDAALVRDSLARTVQHRGGTQNLPMCTGLGRHEFLHDVCCEEVLRAHRYLSRHAPAPVPRRPARAPLAAAH